MDEPTDGSISSENRETFFSEQPETVLTATESQDFQQNPEQVAAADFGDDDDFQNFTQANDDDFGDFEWQSPATGSHPAPPDSAPREETISRVEETQNSPIEPAEVQAQTDSLQSPVSQPSFIDPFQATSNGLASKIFSACFPAFPDTIPPMSFEDLCANSLERRFLFPSSSTEVGSCPQCGHLLSELVSTCILCGRPRHGQGKAQPQIPLITTAFQSALGLSLPSSSQLQPELLLAETISVETNLSKSLTIIDDDAATSTLSALKRQLTDMNFFKNMKSAAQRLTPSFGDIGREKERERGEALRTSPAPTTSRLLGASLSPPRVSQKPLSAEAKALVLDLPDLSFMASQTLVLPPRGQAV